MFGWVSMASLGAPLSCRRIERALVDHTGKIQPVPFRGIHGAGGQLERKNNLVNFMSNRVTKIKN